MLTVETKQRSRITTICGNINRNLLNGIITIKKTNKISFFGVIISRSQNCSRSDVTINTSVCVHRPFSSWNITILNKQHNAVTSSISNYSKIIIPSIIFSKRKFVIFPRTCTNRNNCTLSWSNRFYFNTLILGSNRIKVWIGTLLPSKSYSKILTIYSIWESNNKTSIRTRTNKNFCIVSIISSIVRNTLGWKIIPIRHFIVRYLTISTCWTVTGKIGTSNREILGKRIKTNISNKIKSGGIRDRNGNWVHNVTNSKEVTCLVIYGTVPNCTTYPRCSRFKINRIRVIRKYKSRE
mmetsp:Transcript_132310/g.197127  ORF Transcript_132310/g.197127 Transcript_132310/m.197127 type:complete len:295 (+) Transcript_132310:830-1714(+)